MRETLTKMLGSVRLVQEVSRSSNTANDSEEPSAPTSASGQLPLIENDISSSAPSQLDHSRVISARLLPTVDTSSGRADNSSQTNNNGGATLALNTTYSPTAASLYLPSYVSPRISAFPGWFLNASTHTSIPTAGAQLPVNAVAAAAMLTPPPPPPPPPPSSPTANSNTNNGNSNKSRRKHVRKNSLYTVRHHRPRQASTGHISLAAVQAAAAAAAVAGSNPNQYSQSLPLSEKKAARALRLPHLGLSQTKVKPKSQKLLCLWPLPVVTRYIIGFSVLVSLLNFGGLLDLKCSSPSYVIHRLEIVNLLLSPFLFNVQTVFLFAWNILILGLFEESLAHMLGGTRRFLQLLISIVLSVCTIRQGVGYLFSKSTGFAVPTLFFSDSLHECSQGLAPFLFALLAVQSLSIGDKYILMYGPQGSDYKVTIRKVVLQLLMCLVNYTVKNILWWSLTGLLTGYAATIVVQTCLLRQGRWQDEGDQDDNCPSAISSEKKQAGENPPRWGYRVPLWRSLFSAMKKGAVVVAVTLPALLLFNAYYTRETFVDPATLNQITHDRYMFTFVVMTAPRRGDPPFLSRTLESYLQNWPVDPDPGSLYDRMQALVYTHFTNHTQFDLAKHRFSNDLRGQRYLKWVREEGDAFDQRRHVSKALSLAADNFQSTYVALLEDDFPVCGQSEWHQIENVIYAASQRVPGHCGVFVGTGGSGLFLKPKIAKLASGLLLKYTDIPPDLVIQKCLAGELPECSECSQTLVTSKTLLMYHIGFNTSTSTDRTYKKHDFQCGWRHPFNGDPNVITL